MRLGVQPFTRKMDGPHSHQPRVLLPLSCSTSATSVLLAQSDGRGRCPFVCGAYNGFRLFICQHGGPSPSPSCQFVLWPIERSGLCGPAAPTRRRCSLVAFHCESNPSASGHDGHAMHKAAIAAREPEPLATTERVALPVHNLLVAFHGCHPPFIAGRIASGISGLIVMSRPS